MTLDQIGLKHGTDKASSGHGYLDIYADYFRRFEDRDYLKIIEIGVMGGASLKTWRDYFPRATVWGVDHNRECLKLEPVDRVAVIYDDYTRGKFWEDIVAITGGPVDIIIDDASHHNDHVAMFLSYALDVLRPGGLAIVEDLHASYLPEYGAPTDGRRPVAFTSAMSLVHEMNGFGRVQSGKPDGSSDVAFVHFYRSLCIVGKAKP